MQEKSLNLAMCQPVFSWLYRAKRISIGISGSGYIRNRSRSESEIVCSIDVLLLRLFLILDELSATRQVLGETERGAIRLWGDVGVRGQEDQEALEYRVSSFKKEVDHLNDKIAVLMKELFVITDNLSRGEFTGLKELIARGRLNDYIGSSEIASRYYERFRDEPIVNDIVMEDVLHLVKEHLIRT